MIRLFLLFFIIALSLKAHAADKEITESFKCSRLFSYFERKYRIPLDTLHSISLQETSKIHSRHKIRIVWPWTVNVEGQGYFFDSKKDAVLFVKKQLLAGKTSIDVGCMQINLKHHPNAFKSIEHAFDPVRNVAYGAEFLKSKYDQLGHWLQAIAHYHSATDELGSKYKQQVIKIANNMNAYKYSLKTYASYPYYYTPTKTPYQKITAKPEKIYSLKQNKPNQITNNKVYKTTKSNQPYKKVSFYNKNRSNMIVRVPSRQ